MKNIVYVAAFAFAIYALINMVNWKQPGFFDVSMIVIYSLCLILVVLNAIVYFKKEGLKWRKIRRLKLINVGRKNKERSKYISARSRARSFIKTML